MSKKFREYKYTIAPCALTTVKVKEGTMIALSVCAALLTLFLVQGPLLVSGQATCGPKVSPRLLRELPCDMSKTGYCTVPGGAYPWSSVRRYIFENQGLMRRMYGDERQSLILKNEIDDIRDKYDSFAVNGWLSRGHHNGNKPIFSPRSASANIDPVVPGQQFQYSVLSSGHLPKSSSTEKPATETTAAASPPSQDSLLAPDSMVETVVNVTEDAAYEEATAQPIVSEEWTTLGANTTETATSLKAEEEDLNSKVEQGSTASDSSSSSTPSSSTTAESPNAEDFETEPIEKKGVNACPVKEEVIAPYWANNTRGETLALLNVYPFEQYVHWEKCSYENSQMFCRDGCRCEQQYRLHRLLAFDPKNDCRGIFADWFRFPSCCICICYDLPDTSIFYRINRRKSRL